MEDAIVAVTGATGRLGPHLCARLEELGAHVLPLALPGYPLNPEYVRWRARTSPIGVRSAEDLSTLPAPDYVLNLHWRVDRDLPFAAQIAHEIEANVSGLSHLWSWLCDRSPRAFVNCSSTAVFGPDRGQPFTSEVEPRPASPYGIAKLVGELTFSALLGSDTTRVVHVRLGPVTSPGEHPSRLVSRLLASAFGHAGISLQGAARTSLLYVDEAIDWLIAALHADRERVLLAGIGMSVAEIARLFEQVSGRPLEADLSDHTVAVAPVLVSDVEPLYRPFIRRVGPDEAIRRMIDWWNTR